MIDRVVRTCEIDMFLLSIPVLVRFLHSKFLNFCLSTHVFLQGQTLYFVCVCAGSRSPRGVEECSLRLPRGLT